MESSLGVADALYLVLSVPLCAGLAFALACAGRGALPSSGYTWDQSDSTVFTVLVGFGLCCLGFLGLSLRLYTALPEPESLIGSITVRLSVLALFLGVAYTMSLAVMSSLAGRQRARGKEARRRSIGEHEPED